MGFRTTIRKLIIIVAVGAIVFQKVEPIVLGKISEKIKMPKVNAAEKAAIHLLPNNSSAKAPDKAAPAVLEVVLSNKIAAIGSSILARNFASCFPIFGFCSVSRVT
ncbi:MAG: hypothetical protein BWX66_01342 [Deltaproteobacteria bacterium ADurb.Bin058]|nr:MAG: hypothetical protein BWX66_01342 [Deltaproteobacteria bacterium ADurb.Bin058]